MPFGGRSKRIPSTGRKLNFHDYIIDSDGTNWADLLAGWMDLLPPSVTVWFVNRFGDVFLVMEDGSVHLLDVGYGRIERLADSRDDLANQIDVGDNAEGWLLVPLAAQCLAAELIHSPDQCFGFKVSPILGGEYAVDNIVPTDLSVHYSFLADIYAQTKGLADGTQVRVIRMEED
ncbi:MAG: DUF1851 domain-containing protein [Acidobacteria bacterium]|nr:DUF1851 domain-containing protein [Acidobacteriota bacterium]